jgi:hypothetical protein
MPLWCGKQRGAGGGRAGVRGGTGCGVSAGKSGALAREARSMSTLGGGWRGVRAADRVAECWRSLPTRGMMSCREWKFIASEAQGIYSMDNHHRQPKLPLQQPTVDGQLGRTLLQLRGWCGI